jgi:hypothetical protein
MAPYRSTCLFVPAPDVPRDAQRTLDEWNRWRPRLDPWPVAFVAQDGQEDLDLPDPGQWTTLFIAGSTDWKVSQAAVNVIRRAQDLGKDIHIGRVNWWRRYKHFAQMPGSEGWTCDGTRTRYDGVKRALNAWLDYMGRPVQKHLALPGRDRDR